MRVITLTLRVPRALGEGHRVKMKVNQLKNNSTRSCQVWFSDIKGPLLILRVESKYEPGALQSKSKAMD